MRVQQWLPLNPQGLANVAADPLVQHRRQLHHQHQLAVLHAGNHHELSSARWWPWPRTTSSPRRLASRWPSRSCAASRATRSRLWAISGWISPAPRLRAAAASRSSARWCSCSQGVIQNLASLYQGHHAGRRRADHPAGARRLAGSHQDAGHQWRRIHSTPTPPIPTRTPRRSSNFLADAVRSS